MGAARKLHIPADFIDALPDVCGGRPYVRGTRVKISEIVSRHVFQEQSTDEIVEALPQLSLAQIHAALAYYYEAPAEIEAELRAEDEFVVRMAGRYAPHMAGR